jgi:dTDP-4-dehydrorhamnose reductase
VNAGHCTRYELARDVLAARGLDPSVLQTITTAELARPAPRPVLSALDPMVLRLSNLPLLRHYRDALASYVGRAEVTSR